MGCKVIYDQRHPHVWGKICAFFHILGSPSSYMTLHPIPSEFPYIWGKLVFFFISVHIRPQGGICVQFCTCTSSVPVLHLDHVVIHREARKKIQIFTTGSFLIFRPRVRIRIGIRIHTLTWPPEPIRIPGPHIHLISGSNPDRIPDPHTQLTSGSSTDPKRWQKQ